jgi:hypothetical protein
MDGQTILVVLLSVGFIILTTLSIIFMYILIRILRSIRHIAEKAEETSQDISGTVKAVGKKIAPMALSTLAAAAFRKFRKGR